MEDEAERNPFLDVREVKRPEPVPVFEDDEEKSYEDMTVAELRDVADVLGLEGTSGLKKAELIEAIEAAGEE
jgi:hypothetical protein